MEACCDADDAAPAAPTVLVSSALLARGRRSSSASSCGKAQASGSSSAHRTLCSLEQAAAAAALRPRRRVPARLASRIRPRPLAEHRMLCAVPCPGRCGLRCSICDACSACSAGESERCEVRRCALRRVCVLRSLCWCELHLAARGRSRLSPCLSRRAPPGRVQQPRRGRRSERRACLQVRGNDAQCRMAAARRTARRRSRAPPERARAKAVARRRRDTGAAPGVLLIESAARRTASRRPWRQGAMCRALRQCPRHTGAVPGAPRLPAPLRPLPLARPCHGRIAASWAARARTKGRQRRPAASHSASSSFSSSLCTAPRSILLRPGPSTPSRARSCSPRLSLSLAEPHPPAPALPAIYTLVSTWPKRGTLGGRPEQQQRALSHAPPATLCGRGPLCGRDAEVMSAARRAARARPKLASLLPARPAPAARSQPLRTMLTRSHRSIAFTLTPSCVSVPGTRLRRSPRASPCRQLSRSPRRTRSS
jgi:hypothetical protein